MIEVDLTPSQNAFLEGNFAPVMEEHAPQRLTVVDGELPTELRGTLYRNGPCPAFAPTAPRWHHWFDGHGKVEAFRFDDQGITNWSRWVRTPRLIGAERAGREIVGQMRNIRYGGTLAGWRGCGISPLALAGMALRHALGRPKRPAVIHRIKQFHSAANTHVAVIAGKLVAMEELDYPFELDPDTLDTVGRTTFDGALDGHSMIAHPQVDPVSGRTYTLAFDAVPPYLRYTVLGPGGELVMRRDIDVPWPSMMHSFLLSARYAIFIVWPATFYADHLPTHRPVRWEPQRGARIGVVARDDPHADVRWFDAPAGYAFHYGNAQERGDALVLDLSLHPRLPVLDLGGGQPSPHPIHSFHARSVRWTLHLPTGRLQEEEIDPHPSEFPIVDARFLTRPSRYQVSIARTGFGDGKGVWNAIALTDFERGETRRLDLGARTWTMEAIFAPRPGSEEELDGWLLAPVYRSETHTTDLLILDALRPERGPLCVARMNRRVPYGFHGCWVHQTS